MSVRVAILERGFEKKHPAKRIRDATFRPYWFPVDYSRREIKELGIEFRYHTTVTPALFECDVLILSSRTVNKILSSADAKHESRAEFCAHAKEKVGKLIWFDSRDSAGKCQFDVLPFVDRYLKRQLYRDRSIYLKRLYGGRLYSDYYAKRDGIRDDGNLHDAAYIDTETAPNTNGFEKLRAAWGCGAEFHWPLMNRWSAPSYIASAALWYALGRKPPLPLTTSPEMSRNVDVAALFDSSRYNRKSVGWQRQLALDAVERYRSDKKVLGRVPVDRFYATLANAKVVVSTFGWGEVCFREYEATYCGAAVFMADMSEIETYPDLYVPERYYVPFRWDFSDFEERLDWMLADDQRRTGIATAAQDMLLNQWTPNGRQAFASRFEDLLGLKGADADDDTIDETTED